MLLLDGALSLVYVHIFRFGSNICMNSMIACGTVAWCMTGIFKGLEFCVIPNLFVTFSFPQLIKCVEYSYLLILVVYFAVFVTMPGWDRKRRSYWEKTEIVNELHALVFSPYPPSLFKQLKTHHCTILSLYYYFIVLYYHCIES